MAIVDDDMKEDSLRSVFLNSLISNVDEESLSLEDVAWADSCLNKDVDDSDTDWSSIKDALLEIISAQPEPPATSVVQSSMQLSADEIPQFRENLISMDFGAGSDEDEDLIDGDFGEIESIDLSEDDEDDFVTRNKRGRVRGKVLNVFRPNYSEDVKAENLDSDLNSSLTTFEVNTSLEDIFKVWDLGISDEQDEFGKQLNKALADVPSQIQSSSSDSAVVLNDPMQVSIDDVIAGIGDLSLKQYTE
ncbi:uncharacterized protein LOC110705178 [Chenopodium quinoa]|nr:uncharacterized protein LOC110705178 [Chenopodium quinoa]